MKPLMTLEHVALALHIDTNMVRHLVDSGQLTYYAIEEKIRFSEEQVQAYLNTCEQTTMDVVDVTETETPPKPLKHLSVE